jgi:hypothetical protein
MRDISSASWFVNPVVGLVMRGFDLVQRLNKEMNKEEAFYCSAPAQCRYGLCFKDVTVEDSVKDEDIPYISERCRQYFDWLCILTTTRFKRIDSIQFTHRILERETK